MTDKRPYIPPQIIEAPPPQVRQAVTPKAVVEAAPKEALKFDVKEVVDAESLISHKADSARANFLELHPRKERVFDTVESAVAAIEDSPSIGDAKKIFFEGQKGKLQAGEVEQADAIFDSVYERMQQTEGSAEAARLPGNLPGVQASDAALARARESPEYDLGKVSGVDSLIRRHESLDNRPATIAVDFSGLHLPDGSQLTGAGLHCDESNRANIVGQVAKILKAEGRSPQEIAQFMDAAMSAESLSLINKGRGGMSARRIISHEHNHGLVNSISRENRRLIWDTMGDAERQRATDYVSRNWGIKPRDTDAIMDEYFTEALTNAGQWGQQGGLTAEAGTLEDIRTFASEASSRRRTEATRKLISELANPETRGKAILRLTALAREDAEFPTADGPYNELLKARGKPKFADGIAEVIDRIHHPENYVAAPEAAEDAVFERARKLQKNLARSPGLRDFEANMRDLHQGLFGTQLPVGDASHVMGREADFAGMGVSWCQSQKDTGKVSPGVAGAAVDSIADHIGASVEEVRCFLLGQDKSFREAFIAKYGNSDRVRELRGGTPLRMPEHLEPASMRAEPAGRVDDAAVSSEREVIADACSRVLVSPASARQEFLATHPGQERLFDAVDTAVDCVMGCGSREEAQKAFSQRMRARGSGQLEGVFDAAYDRVMEAEAGGVPGNTLMLDSESVRRMGTIIKERASSMARKVDGFIEDVVQRIVGGSFANSSAELERILHERVIPAMEAQNFEAAKNVLEAEGRWDGVYAGVAARVRDRVGAESFDAMDEPTRNANMRDDLYDELEGRGYHIRVKDPPTIRWASHRIMGESNGRYTANKNLIEINRGFYFNASDNPEKIDQLQGVIGTGVMGHELYHAEQRTHEMGKILPTLYDGTVFRLWAEAPERRQDLFNLWHTMTEGAAEFASVEPQQIQYLLDVEAKVISRQPLNGLEQWDASTLLYNPYQFGVLALAAIRDQVTDHYKMQGLSEQQAKAVAQQIVGDYVRQIVPGMERSMVEGLSVSEVAQMTNIRDSMYHDYVTARERMGRPYLTADEIMAAAPAYTYNVLNNEVGLRQAELFHSQTVQIHLQDKVNAMRAQGEDTQALEKKLKEIDARVRSSAEQLIRVWDQRHEYEEAHNMLPTFEHASDTEAKDSIIILDFNLGRQTQR
jgi:hypothetical protein